MDIWLRSPSLADHSLFVEWRNSSLDTFFSSSPITEESHLKWWYEHVLHDDTQVLYTVMSDKLAIGMVGLKDIDRWTHKRAEYGRFLIAPTYRGHGYGKQTLSALLAHAFDASALDLNRIYGYILANNYSGLTTALSAGFSIEGVLKQHVYKNSAYLDVISVGITADDWRGL